LDALCVWGHAEALEDLQRLVQMGGRGFGIAAGS
jgi:hypothetical protein